tara:strand:- start:884 stop:1222 length:339 start_codon:yes stop_codon:yes gene_type:complete
MVTIIEWVTHQQFESKKLASEYFNIPITKINKSINQKTTIEYKNKYYTFRLSTDNEGQTRILKPSRKSTQIKFGKYKGKEPSKVPLSYLLWMRENIKPCPSCVIKFLKDKGH